MFFKDALRDVTVKTACYCANAAMALNVIQFKEPASVPQVGEVPVVTKVWNEWPWKFKMWSTSVFYISL